MTEGITLLRRAQILEWHEQLAKKYNFDPTPPNEEKLSDTLMSVFDDESISMMTDIASAHDDWVNWNDTVLPIQVTAAERCVGIIKNKPFKEGNYHIALALTIGFLYAKGFRLDSSERDLIHMLLSLSRLKTRPAIENFAIWLNKNLLVV